MSVKRGEAAFERDSVAKESPEIQWQIIGAVGVARALEEPFTVLDFGGSLGSLYFQHREILRIMNLKSWTVVEQAHYVAAGQEFLSDGTLGFQANIENVPSDEPATLAIFSSVLHYLEDYLSPLRHVLNNQTPIVCIDRTFLTSSKDALVFMQIVPPNIYTASYPCWLIPETEILGLFSEAGYTVVANYVNDPFPAVNARGGTFGGFIAVSDECLSPDVTGRA